MTPSEAESHLRRGCDAATEREALAVLAGSPDPMHQTIAREWRGKERVVSEWQPIETAPKDGTWILIACQWDLQDWDGGDWCRIARWDERPRYKGFTWATMDPDGITFGGSIREDVATHWMPLPPPPAREGGRDE